MCKVFGVAGVNEKNRGTIIQIMKDITPDMTRNEDDGLGYAAIDAMGNVFGEKWLDPEKAWKKGKRRRQPASQVITKLDAPILSELHDAVDTPSELNSPPTYDKFGTGELKNAVAFILHSRLSTGGANSVKIENVHPFVKEGTALIHNGIVYNEEKFTKTISSCDSEILLNQYLDYNVNLDSRRLSDAMFDVDAYFACLVLSNTILETEEVVPILDIYQNGANLRVIHVHDLGATFYLTSAIDLIDICKEKGWTTSHYFSVKEDVLIRLNAITGKVMEKEEFFYESRRSNYFNNWTKEEKELYYKSKYNDEYEKYSKEGKDDPEDEPAYRNGEHGVTITAEEIDQAKDEVDERENVSVGNIYDATRLPFADEMDIFRRYADHMGRRYRAE